MKKTFHQLRIAWGFSSGALFASMAWTMSLDENWFCCVVYFVSIMMFYFALREARE
jgi:RsiW-degrading membrane proteinase PrsW (M82 family)